MKTGLIGLVVFALDIWAIVSIFNSNESNGTKALWIIGVVVFPFFGFLAWFFAGPRPGR